jgi:hypothetical protein
VPVFRVVPGGGIESHLPKVGAVFVLTALPWQNLVKKRDNTDMKRISIVASALLLLSVLWFVGCQGIFATPIGDLVKTPRDYDGKHLKIS